MLVAALPVEVASDTTLRRGFFTSAPSVCLAARSGVTVAGDPRSSRPPRVSSVLETRPAPFRRLPATFSITCLCSHTFILGRSIERRPCIPALAPVVCATARLLSRSSSFIKSTIHSFQLYFDAAVRLYFRNHGLDLGARDRPSPPRTRKPPNCSTPGRGGLGRRTAAGGSSGGGRLGRRRKWRSRSFPKMLMGRPHGECD